jgi:hypothetical protein
MTNRTGCDEARECCAPPSSNRAEPRAGELIARGSFPPRSTAQTISRAASEMNGGQHLHAVIHERTTSSRASRRIALRATMSDEHSTYFDLSGARLLDRESAR